MEEVFLPFVRTDRYGENGERPQPLFSRLLLSLAAVTILPLKLTLTLTCLISFNIVCHIASLLPECHRHHVIAELGKLHCRACLFCLGFLSIKWVTIQSSSKPTTSSAPAGIVSNHMGWSDILIHMSRSFPSFVARDGTQNIPFVGFISQKMNCVYVEREAKGGERGGVARKVKERMQYTASTPSPALRPILLFPEGTTTNGRYLLPFKTGAFLAGLPLQPVIIEYAPAAVSPCWESIVAKRHLFLVLSHLAFSATCFELPVYKPSEAEKADPVLFAANVRRYMLDHSRMQASSATLEDKRRYHAIIRGESPPAASPKAPADKKGS